MALKGYIVCLTFNRTRCVEQTERIATKHNAHSFVVEPVAAPMSLNPAYRGTIFLEQEVGDAIVRGRK